MHTDLADKIQVELDKLIDSISRSMVQHNMDDPIVKEFFLSCVQGCANLQRITDELRGH